jgi:hypothetical protein
LGGGGGGSGGFGFSSGGLGGGGFAAGGAGGAGAAGLGMSTIVTMTGADAIKVALLGGRSTRARNTPMCATSETMNKRRKALLESRLSTGT